MGGGLHKNFKNTLASKLEEIDVVELANDAPIDIPRNAEVKKQIKKGYIQIKYIWQKDGEDYLARWHTPTPGSPINYPSWVIEKVKKGIGFGKNFRPAETSILLKNKKWISKEIWKKGTTAKFKGTLTKELKEILNNGHHRSKI